MKLLELFKGTGSVGKVAKKMGYEVVSLDLDPIFTPDIETDILYWDYKKFYNDTKFIPDIIWASPPCNTFSPLAYSLKERDTKTAEPKSERAKEGTKILHKTLEIIDFFKKKNPKLDFVIENPRGMMRHDKKIQKLVLNNTYYCLYGDKRRKSTDFFSNRDLGLISPEEEKCEGDQVLVVDLPLEDRYKIPSKLIKHIFNVFKNKSNNKDMDGNGILLRDPGKLPPSARKQLEKVGNEKITKIVAVRTPLSSTTKTFLNIISLGQFEKISKQYFDELFHLAFWINDKYNLEKNEVISFGTKNPIKSNSETQTITINKDITFNELMENTRKYMGDNNFTSYNAEKNNCQNFLVSILNANGIGTDSEKKWIKQDTEQVFKEVPTFAKVLGNLSTTAGAIVNRLIEGEGRPRRLYITDDGRYYYVKDKKRRFIKMPDNISQKQVVKINIGNLVKPKKKRKRKAIKKLVKPEVIGTISRTGLPPPVLIRAEPPKPKSGDESKELLKSIESILKLREPTKIGAPTPITSTEEISRLESKLVETESELENTKREEKQAREELIELEKQLKNIDNEIMGARLEGSRNMLIMKQKELKEAQETLDFNVNLLNDIIRRQNAEIKELENIIDELNYEKDLTYEKEAAKEISSRGKTRIRNLPEILKQFVSVNKRQPENVDEINNYIFPDFYDEKVYTKISKSFFDKTMKEFEKQMEAIIEEELKPVESLLSSTSTSKMAGKGNETPCYNPLSLAYANMPIGLEIGNPLFKTEALTSSTTTTTTTTKPTTESKKDEPQKPDEPQKGNGLVGDVINLFNPSATTTTRVLGLGFGMGGGCSGMNACGQCGNGVVGDFLNTATEKFQKLKAEADADIQLRKTNPVEWQRRQDAKKAEMDRLKEEIEKEKKRKEDERKAKEAELNRKLNRPLEWYETAGKFLTGKAVGAIVPGGVGLVASTLLGQDVECKMRDLNPEECRIFRERQRGKGEEQVDGLYNDEIETIADNLGIKVPVIASDQIDKIVDMIKPSTKEFGFIINTDDSNGPGKHWRAIFIDNDEDRPSIEFFDPLGDAPEPQLIEDIKKIVDKLDNEKYFLFKENMIQLQSDDTNHCGHFSLKFLEDRFNGVPWSEATGFKKCINQSGVGEKEISESVKKYENYL